MVSGVRVVAGGRDDLDGVGPLFASMVEHHRAVAGEQWPVREPAQAWRRRRAEYEEWLAAGADLLLALPDDDETRPPLGYAVLRVTPSGPSWDLGDAVGELESLAVAPQARGRGVGRALVGAAAARLHARGVRYWGVAVVEANADAVRFYETLGFRPYYRRLLAAVPT